MNTRGTIARTDVCVIDPTARVFQGRSFLVGSLLALLSFGIPGCGPWRATEPLTPSVQETDQISLQDLYLKTWIRIVRHKAFRLGGGQLQAKIAIENVRDRDILTDIQVIFRDKDGFEVEKSNWEPVMLTRRKVTDFHMNSIGPGAADYRILIRQHHRAAVERP